MGRKSRGYSGAMRGDEAPTLASHLELPSVRVAPGARVSYSVVNDGPVPIMLGLHYWLERQADRGWERLPSGIFRLIGYYLPEGAVREFDFRIPEDAQPGRYRLCKCVRADSDPRPGSESLGGHQIDPIELAAEFEVIGSR